MEEFVQIGFTQKTHGVAGELRISIEEAYLEDFLESDVLFLEIGGKKIPYFIEQVRGAYGDILKIEDINSKEEAQKLTSVPVFLRLDDLQTLVEEGEEEDAETFAFLEGYQAEDHILGPIGEIIRVDEYPQQEIAVVVFKGREVLIPLAEQIIVSIDESKQKIRFNLPEGLLEL